MPSSPPLRTDLVCASFVVRGTVHLLGMNRWAEGRVTTTFESHMCRQLGLLFTLLAVCDRVCWGMRKGVCGQLWTAGFQRVCMQMWVRCISSG